MRLDQGVRAARQARWGCRRKLFAALRAEQAAQALSKHVVLFRVQARGREQARAVAPPPPTSRPPNSRSSSAIAAANVRVGCEGDVGTIVELRCTVGVVCSGIC